MKKRQGIPKTIILGNRKPFFFLVESKNLYDFLIDFLAFCCGVKNIYFLNFLEEMVFELFALNFFYYISLKLYF